MGCEAARQLKGPIDIKKAAEKFKEGPFLLLKSIRIRKVRQHTSGLVTAFVESDATLYGTQKLQMNARREMRKSAENILQELFASSCVVEKISRYSGREPVIIELYRRRKVKEQH